nr:hypothetical protein [uncultured Flavobacterium sp.]
MARTPYHSAQVNIASGTTGGTINVTPQTGRIIGACLYHNNENNAVNPGVVSLAVTTAGGTEILPNADIRHYRNRNAGYSEGFVPMEWNSDGTSFQLKFNASQAFTAAFVGTFLFFYDPCTE